jgi:restriction endonuclease Mrr
MATLDGLSGFEFEDLMEDVFRNLGYENVRQSSKTADEGRDIVMEEVVDGQRRTVVVECKHTGKVSRPVVQKLHSAVSTFDVEGPKRGVIVTTGEFTGPAEEYAAELNRHGHDGGVELIDGEKLRAIGEEIGLDLYNGRIEILCDETLRPSDPTGSIDDPLREAFRDVENVRASAVPDPTASVSFDPILTIEADVDAVFETSVGVIHRIDERDRFVIRGDRGSPEILDDEVRRLVEGNQHATVELDEDRFRERFDDVECKRFGQTETEYKDWAVDRLQRRHTTTVEYTGDNNVDYSKECEPNLSEISIQHITPVYLPQVRLRTQLGEYSYPLEFYAAGPSRLTLEDGIRECVQCGEASASTYTHCENCGSVNCPDHTETERLEGEPVCTGCAVTERFALATKYFYDEENLEAFRREYERMPVHEKAMENPPLVAGSVLTGLLVVFALLSTAGIV